LLNAQVNLAATKRNINVAAYSLLSSVGRLNIQELGAADEVYDAEIHYHEVRRKWWGVSITHAHGKTEHHDFWEKIGKMFHESHGDPVEPTAKPAGRSKPVK
jgi:outer membrane protein